MSLRAQALLALAAIVLAAGAVATGFAYYPAIAPTPPPSLSTVQPGPAAAPLARHVVVVVLDGARRDAFEGLAAPSSGASLASAAHPALAALRQRAATFRGRSELLTISRPMYATLGSGASPRLHGVATNSRAGAVPVDSVFAAARRAGLEVVLRDDRTSWWWDLFAAPPEERASTVAETLVRLRRAGRTLAYVHVLDADDAAHLHGAASSEYTSAIGAAATVVEQLAAALDLSRDTLLVTSDHGHRERGGHGGQEREVVEVPLWLVGAGVRPGTFGDASLVDVAPTVAVLAGLGLPAHSEGRPLFEALELPPSAVEPLAQRWLSQRWALSNAVLGDVGGTLLPPPSAVGALTVEAAAERVAASAGAMSAALHHRDVRERWWRALAVLPLLAGVLYALRRFRVGVAAVGLALVGAALFYGAWSVLFPFSLSALRVKGEFYAHLAVLAGLAAALIALLAWAAGRARSGRQGGRAPRLLLQTGVAVVGLGLLEVGACFALYGLGLASGLPPPEGFVLPAQALSRIAAASLLWGLLVPFLAGPRAARR